MNRRIYIDVNKITKILYGITETQNIDVTVLIVNYINKISF